MIISYNKEIYTCETSDEINNWFPRICCKKHALYDNRTPGLFKIEFTGKEMIALCSKTYIINNDEKHKFSCKGINKQNLDNINDIYKGVLETQIPYSSLNMGFILKDNLIFTYSMLRSGFTYFYCKRKVLGDGIHTEPLNIVLEP